MTLGPRRCPGRLRILGEPGELRTTSFLQTARDLGWEADLVPWTAILAAAPRPPVLAPLLAGLTPGAWLRIDSPGASPEVDRLLRSDCPLGSASGKVEPGRLLPRLPRARGLERALRALADLGRAHPWIRLQGSPLEMAEMCDKRRTRSRLEAAGVPLPRGLGTVGSHAELTQVLDRARVSRVFLKPPHGSSASGVLAYQRGGRRESVTTSVELVRQGAEVRLFNSLHLRRYTDPGEVALLVDLLARDLAPPGARPDPEAGLLVEEWIPKQGCSLGCFDLRLLVIGGEARQVVVRTSQGPLTNLHLGNRRGDPLEVRRLLGEPQWTRGHKVAEAAAACFPASLQVAIDLAFPLRGGTPVVLEVNAWGDHLPGVENRGESCHQAELTVMARRSGEWASSATSSS